MERQKGFRHPRTGTIPENEEAVSQDLCAPKDIAKGLKTSQLSVRKMIKRKGIKQLKRLKTPYMNYATQKGHFEHSGCLLEKFEASPQMIERAVFQDEFKFESEFLLQISISSQNDRAYFKGQKKMLLIKNLSHQTNRQSVRVMLSAALISFGVIKPLFVIKIGLNFNIENYCKHL